MAKPYQPSAVIISYPNPKSHEVFNGFELIMPMQDPTPPKQHPSNALSRHVFQDLQCPRPSNTMQQSTFCKPHGASRATDMKHSTGAKTCVGQTIKQLITQPYRTQTSTSSRAISGISVLAVAILLVQAWWFWHVLTNLPRGWFGLQSLARVDQTVCSEQLIPAETHLHHLALHQHCFCPRFNTCSSCQSEIAGWAFFSKLHPSVICRIYAWMFLDMAVTWAILHSLNNNHWLQPTKSMIHNGQSYDTSFLHAWDSWIEADLIGHHTPQGEILITCDHGWKHWGEDLENPGWSELQ